MEKNNISLIRYIALFSVIYAALMLLFNAVVYGFNIDIDSSANIAMLLGASYGTIARFVSEQKRTPNTLEKRKLIWGSILSSFIVSLAVVATVLTILGNPEAWDELNQLIHQLSIPIWLGIIAFVTLLYYIVLNLVYGWGAKQFAKKRPTASNVDQH
jgi:peptidoglycan biosynthesis protein MviN/MurJ (putative lipid II flippase)